MGRNSEGRADEPTNRQTTHGSSLIKSAIRKDRPGKASTYTLRYLIRESETRRLF